MDFTEQENHDGVRFSWNVFPSSRVDEKRLSIPIGALYSPLKPLIGLGLVQYRPVLCSSPNCGAVLSPYCALNYQTKIWVCPFCHGRNSLPPHYAAITPENCPAEVMSQYTTLEYVLDASSLRGPAFVFVVDLTVISEELASLKRSLVETIALLPSDAEVSLITFGRDVHVYDLSFPDCLRSVTLRGSKTYAQTDVRRLLGLHGIGGTGNTITSSHPGESKSAHGAAPNLASTSSNLGLGSGSGSGSSSRTARRYLTPLTACESTLVNTLEALQPDAWPHPAEQRPERCSGTAISVALHLLEETHRGANARVLTFLGGPPSVGQGAVVTPHLKDPIRSHRDLQRDEAPLYDAAKTFYGKLAAQAGTNGHIIDVFACSLDQVGLAEMTTLVSGTGGNVVLDDSFSRGVFRGSLHRLFVVDPEDNNSLVMAFGGELQVMCSRELRVQGAVGQVSSLARPSHCVSEQTLGVGKTCAWRLGGLDHNSTIALFFERAADGDKAKAGANPAQGNANNTGNSGGVTQAYFQFATRYRHSSGRVHLRVTTVAKPITDMATSLGIQHIRAGFDQEAAAAVMTRLGLSRAETDFPIDVLRWLDRSLIRLAGRFGSFNKGDPASFRLGQEMQFFPQFMFYLRRSQFLQIFNSSPDETAFYRMVAMKETTTNTLVMIQPTLTAYSASAPTTPVMLDTSALASDRILLLDTYFHIVIWYGGMIVSWRSQNLHLQPEYAHLAQLLQAPVTDAMALMERRFPAPRFIECVEGGSQARFLMAKLNPSLPSTSAADYAGGAPPIFTEDVSLKTFLQHLKKLAVEEVK